MTSTQERLRQTYERPQSWLRKIGVARIGVLFFITVGPALMRGPEGAGLVLFLYILGFCSSIWYLYTLARRGSVGFRHTWLQILVDFCVVGVTVFITGGPTSFFTFLLVIVVLEAGLLLGLASAFVVSTLATVFMLLVLLFDLNFFPMARPVGRSEFELWYNFLVQSLAFYLTAFISGYWSQRVHRLQQFQREILDNMSSGFLITDRDGIVLSQNRAGRHILELEAWDTAGRPVGEVLRVAPSGECPIVTALRSGRDFTSYEFRAYTGNSQTKLLGLTTNRVLDAQGEVIALISTFTDLTEVERIREEMRRQDRLAYVGELAAGLAHEIRNPVAVVRGAMDEIRSRRGDAPLVDRLTEIALRESDHLNDIVTGFLDFARAPSTRRELFDLRRLAAEVADLIAREYEESTAVEVIFEAGADPCPVSADRSQIKQVFVNLAKNGIEAMNGSGRLWITLWKTPGSVEVRFGDEGPGISPDQVARIFEPFYTTKESGVGMGLAVCLRLITAHDGSLRALAREGGGCSMIVRLPAIPAKE